VIGTGSPATHDDLRALGAEPVVYGDQMSDQVRAIAPSGVDLALDVAGSGVLPELIDLAGGPEHVVTIADFLGARDNNVRFSRGDTGRATYALAEVADMAAAGRFAITVGGAFPLTDIAHAHRIGESGTVRGKLILTMA